LQKKPNGLDTIRRLRLIAIHHDRKTDAPLVARGIEIDRIGIVAIKLFGYRVGVDVCIPPRSFADIGLFGNRGKPPLAALHIAAQAQQSGIRFPEPGIEFLFSDARNEP